MIMGAGVIEQIGTPLEIYNQPKTEYIREFVINHLNQKLESLMKCTGKIKGEN